MPCRLFRPKVPLPSFRRRPESILVFLLIWDVSREPAHVRVSSFDIPVDRSLSFACPKESNQRKGHPRGRGRRGIHAPATSRAGSGVRRQYVPVQSTNSPPSWRRSLRDFSSTCSPRPGGDPGKSKARQSLPQKLTDSSSPRRRGPSAFGVAPLLISGPSVKRRRSAGQGRVPRTRCGPGRPAFGDRAGALPPNPADRSEPAACGRRVTEGAFLWLLSLCKQRK